MPAEGRWNRQVPHPMDVMRAGNRRPVGTTGHGAAVGTPQEFCVGKLIATRRAIQSNSGSGSTGLDISLR